MTTRCAHCGKDPAEGLATIDDERYCHGDWQESPTCYEIAGQRLPDDRPSFHDLLARYVARHACEVHAETAGCPHLTPTWDDAADFTSSPTAHAPITGGN